VASLSSVFLSHSSHDREWSRKLAGDLEQAGVSVFLDEWDISHGDLLIARLNDGLRTASDGLIVWGVHTRESPWVRAECEFLVHEAIRNDKRLISVILADVDLPPRPSGMSSSPRSRPLATTTSARGTLTAPRSPSPARPGTPSWKSAATWDSAPWRWPLATTTRPRASARRPGTTRGRRSTASTPSWKEYRSVPSYAPW